MRSNYPLAWATDGHHTRRRSITPTVKKCGCIAARIFAPNRKKITLIVHDYANSVLFGSPITVLQLLQRVQNSLVRVVLQADRSASSTALLQQIHWLSVEKNINFKLATLTYKALASGSPAYLSSLLTPYDPVRTLRSSDQLLLQRFPTKTNFGSRAFRSVAPLWNSLSYPVKAFPTLSSFKRALKNNYFRSAFHPHRY